MDACLETGFHNANPRDYRFARVPYESLERQEEYEALKAIFDGAEPGLIEDIRSPHPLTGIPIDIQRRSFQAYLEPPFVNPVVFAPYCVQMDQVYAADDRHLTANTEHFERVLSNINLTGMNILEIGYGTGYLTEIILRQNINHYRGYDINEPKDGEMPESLLADSRAKFIVEDFTKDDFSFMREGEWAVISNPPYFLIPIIKKQIIEPFQPLGVVLITSQARARDYPGYVVESVQDGMDFDPPAKGLHFVITDGFDRRWSPDYLHGRSQKPTILGTQFPECPSNKYGPWDMQRFTQYDLV